MCFIKPAPRLDLTIGNAPYAVKGHPFGLDLTDEEREELIAFLKTL